MYSRMVGLKLLLGLAVAFFLVVASFMLYITWTKGRGVMDQLITTALVLSFLWSAAAACGWILSFQKVRGTSSVRLMFGPRPLDSDHLRAWKWGRHFRYAVVSVLILMVAFGLTI